MPWKVCSVMEERLRFVARLLDGESMTDVCREFGISRKTGYKLLARYREEGACALTDCSRRLRQPAPAPTRGPRRPRQARQAALGGGPRIPPARIGNVRAKS